MELILELASVQAITTFSIAAILAAIGLVLVLRGDPSAWPEDETD